VTDPSPGRYATFLFPTTTHVLWAEEVAVEGGVPVEIIPAPAGFKKLCGLAIRALPERGAELEALFGAEEIPFTRL
jgi:hypothetical protein